MDLTLTDNEQAFRDEFRAWIEENHPGPAPQGGDQVQYEFERSGSASCTRAAGPESPGRRNTAAAARP